MFSIQGWSAAFRLQAISCCNSNVNLETFSEYLAKHTRFYQRLFGTENDESLENKNTQEKNFTERESVVECLEGTKTKSKCWYSTRKAENVQFKL